MTPFKFLRVIDETAAVEAGQRGRFLAGGTNLVDLMKIGVESPASVVDVSQVPLARVEELPEAIRIGALVRNSDLAWHPLVERELPMLATALLSGASPQLRNLATTGGNLLQRTRCAYFRDAENPACNKRHPGSGCAAMDGWTRMHAILGASAQCIAVNPSDMNVALAALDAVVTVRGTKGVRQIPMAAFHTVPGDHPEIESTLQPDELVTHVTVPKNRYARSSAYVKVRDRASYAFAVASCGAALEIDGGIIKSARIALGGVATKPWRVPEAEALLVGQAPSVTAFQAAAERALQGAQPRRDNGFKVALAKRTIVRALGIAGGAA